MRGLAWVLHGGCSVVLMVFLLASCAGRIPIDDIKGMQVAVLEAQFLLGVEGAEAALLLEGSDEFGLEIRQLLLGAPGAGLEDRRDSEARTSGELTQWSPRCRREK